jgi:DNA-binding protein YbaB
MSGRSDSPDFWGTALNGAVEVSVDEHGRVRSVRLHPTIVRRVGPEQLERGVVAAHAAARAAASDGGSS